MGRRKKKANKPEKEKVAEEALTPYQGKNRSFGEFHCIDCNRYWASAHTYANTYQQCDACKEKIYPFRQHKLIKKAKKKRDKPKKIKEHRYDLCGKCHELGTYCHRDRAIYASG